jgi:hypothetical protein
VKGAAVEMIRFAGMSSSSQRLYRIGLKSGGQVAGDLRRLSDETLELETDWKSPLTLPRSSIQQLTRRLGGARTFSLLDAPLEDWSLFSETYQPLSDRPDIIRRSPAGWQLQAGEYYYTSDPLPSDRVTFDIQVKRHERLMPGVFSVEVGGFTDPDGQQRRVGVQIESRRVQAEVRGGGGQVERWSGFLSDTGDSSLRINLQVNGESDRLHLEVVGHFTWELPISEWEFSPELSPYRVWLNLYGDSQDLLIEKLSLTQESRESRPELQQSDHAPGQVVFENGDRMSAELLTIDNGNATLRLQGGREIQTPLERLFHVSLPGSDRVPLRRRASHARFTLRGGEELLTAQVLGATADAFVVRREGIPGTFRLPVDDLTKVELNPYFLR